MRTMNQLKRKKVNIIISTDLLSRGIDISSIDLVINFDAPNNIETYFHRIGRTARYGRYYNSFKKLFIYINIFIYIHVKT